MVFLRVPWYSLYSSAVDATWLSDVVRAHAAAVAIAAGASRIIQALLRRREVARFEAACRDAAPPPSSPRAADDAIGNGATDAEADFPACLAACAHRVYGVPSLRPRQVEAAAKIMFDSECRGRLLVVDRTGSGKSLILQTVATCVGGITLVIVPLLSLTANQLSRLELAGQNHGSVKAVHLDETPDALVRSVVIPKMKGMRGDGSDTLVLFCSPQYLVDHHVFRAALLDCHRRRILRLLGLDEAHIYAMHGRSFRGCIRVLRDVFLVFLFGPNASHSPLFLAMTATMPKSLLEHFSALTHVNFGNPRHQLWASAENFQQRNISIQLRVRGGRQDLKQCVLAPIVDLLRHDKEAHVYLFVNFRSEVVLGMSSLEDMLSEALLREGVLGINGDIDKVEKFANTRLFTSSLVMRGHRFRVLVATPAANTGLDQPCTTLVTRYGLPRDTTTLLQEKGRLVRRAGMSGDFVLYTDWAQWLFLVVSSLSTMSSSDKNESSYAFSNSVIESRSPDKRQGRAAPKTTVPPRERNPRPLTSAEKKALRAEAYDDVRAVVELLFLPDWGCVHLRCEWLLATGKNTRPTRDFVEKHGKCGNKCFVCSKEHRKYMLPIVPSGAMDFLSSDAFATGMENANPITFENARDLPKVLSQNADNQKLVFNVKTVPAYNINAFFFQLVATGILEFVWQNNGKELCYALSKNIHNQHNYKDIRQWSGFEFRTAQPTGRLMSFASQLAHGNIENYMSRR